MSFMSPSHLKTLQALKPFLEQGRAFTTNAFTHFIIQPTNQPSVYDLDNILI